MISTPAMVWPFTIEIPTYSHVDVPTRVVMSRSSFMAGVWWLGCPHPRGDGPRERGRTKGAGRMSPPAWGWPGVGEFTGERLLDVPTRVGMARQMISRAAVVRRCTHPRGDGPATQAQAEPLF